MGSGDRRLYRGVQPESPYAAFEAAIPWWYIMNPSGHGEREGGDMGQEWMKDHSAGSGPLFKRGGTRSPYELEAVENYWKGWENPNTSADSSINHPGIGS